MEFTNFVRRPFQVEAVRITEANIDEIAPIIGEIKMKGTEKFILIDKRIVPGVPRAFVGWWVTRFNDQYKCYANKVFNDQFMPYTDEWAGWFEVTPTEAEIEFAQLVASQPEYQHQPGDVV